MSEVAGWLGHRRLQRASVICLTASAFLEHSRTLNEQRGSAATSLLPAPLLLERL